MNNPYKYVADMVKEWELSPQESINEINKIIEGIKSAIRELDNVLVDFSDLEKLQEAFEDRKEWYKEDV